MNRMQYPSNNGVQEGMTVLRSVRLQAVDAYPGFTPVRVKYSEWLNPALEHTGERILWSDGSAHGAPEDDGEFVTVLRSRANLSAGANLTTIWQRVKCAFFGHRWQVGPDDCPSDVAAERNCVCGAHWPAVVWPKGVSKDSTIWSPTGPRPGMHPPPPARVITEDAYNRKHKLGAYDPHCIAQVQAFNAWTAAQQVGHVPPRPIPQPRKP